MADYYCDNKRHLVCIPYSVENLHEMAKDLEIKKCWYSIKPWPHYDIPLRRIDEIQSKCNVVNFRDIVNIKRGTFKNENK